MKAPLTEYLKAPAAAEMLGVCVTTLRKWTEEYNIPTKGPLGQYHITDLHTFMDNPAEFKKRPPLKRKGGGFTPAVW